MAPLRIDFPESGWVQNDEALSQSISKKKQNDKGVNDLGWILEVFYDSACKYTVVYTAK